MPTALIRQRGAVAVEFALVTLLFLALVIAVIEFARVMFIYSTAVETTRLGARIATVCNVGDADKVKARMKHMLPLLEPANILMTYPAAGCSAATCDPVTVSIQNLTVTTAIPLLPLTFPVPAFPTSLPGESLDSTNNALCD